jgi:hypothetical protein
MRHGMWLERRWRERRVERSYYERRLERRWCERRLERRVEVGSWAMGCMAGAPWAGAPLPWAEGSCVCACYALLCLGGIHVLCLAMPPPTATLTPHILVA